MRARLMAGKNIVNTSFPAWVAGVLNSFRPEAFASERGA